MSKRLEMKCKRCGANENRIHGFCSMECETAWEYEDEIRDLTARIAELEATVEIHADISNAYEKRISEIVSLSNKANAKLQVRIAELEAAHRWRVVADGELPNKNDYYLARDDLGQQGMILFYDGEWNKFTNLSYITRWMPLPEPPEVQK